MAVITETGTWTGGGSTPQTITLANGSLTPVAIIVWMVRQGAAAAGFVASQHLYVGLGTRRSAATQSGCGGIVAIDAVTTTDSSRVRGTELLRVLSNTSTTDYTVSLDSFSAGSFQVSYSNAANANGDVFHYWVIGGISDAIVLNATLSGTGASEAETGAGFLPECMLCLDTDLATAATPTALAMLSFGCATSASQFWCVSMTATDGDTMTSQMNWNKSARTDACLERLTINADTSDARWDLDSFDSDGFTLGIVDAPTNTDRVSTFLLLKGLAAEAGSKNKSGSTGNDTFTLTNSALAVKGILLGCIRAVTGITAADTTLALGAGSTPNATQGSAVNNCVGVTGPEALATTADRFSATDAVIEELTGGASPAETSVAWYDTASTGSFVIDWATNGGSTNPVFYLAIGEVAVTEGVSSSSLAVTTSGAGTGINSADGASSVVLTTASAGASTAESAGTSAAAITVAAAGASTAEAAGASAAAITDAGVGASTAEASGTSAFAIAVAGVGEEAGGTTDGVSSSALAVTVASVGTGINAAAGASSLAVTDAGVGASTAAADAASAAAVTVAGTGASTFAGDGLSACVVAVTSTGASTAAATGTSLLACTVASVGSSTAEATSACSMAVTVAGVGSDVRGADGLSSCTITVSGVGVTIAEGVSASLIAMVVAAGGSSDAVAAGVASIVFSVAGVGQQIGSSEPRAHATSTSTIAPIAESTSTLRPTATSNSTLN